MHRNNFKAKHNLLRLILLQLLAFPRLLFNDEVESEQLSLQRSSLPLADTRSFPTSVLWQTSIASAQWCIYIFCTAVLIYFVFAYVLALGSSASSS